MEFVPVEDQEIDNNHLWQCLWSFLSGAALIGVFWAWQTLRGLLPDEIAADDTSWVDPWNTLREKSWKVIVENSDYYFQNNIGELPTRTTRAHWPWETIRPRFSSQTDAASSTTEKYTIGTSLGHQGSSFETADEDGYESTRSQSNDEGDTSTREEEICIGSIFGMDVGGTLAKLVYFEQKASDYDPLASPLRERHSVSAASAQTVVMARASCSTSDILSSFGSANTSTTSSSTSRLAGETQIDQDGAANRPMLIRRRSLSLGCMGRHKDLQKELLHQDSHAEKLKQIQQPQHCAVHSLDSELDLAYLKNMRQESVPDDLSHFRGAVQFNGLSSEETRPTQSKTKESDSPEAAPPRSNMKKSRSMFNLTPSQKKAEALDRFYIFARRLDSDENSVRDHKLAFYSRELGGEFHFLHFESRRMHHAMDLIRYHNLHMNISKMGATGGGAHKYAKEWDQLLGIQMDKQDELDSLVAGMQFVLATVVGECYTFRPNTTDPNETQPSPSAEISSSPKTASPSASDNAEMVDDHQVGAPIVDESFTDEDEDLGAATNYIPSTAAPFSSSKTQGKDDAQADGVPKSKAEIDEWWWSRKVQRDAISYSTSYPYLLVTIGTGVSILRVDGPRQHERISGSTIGGGTYWGLIRLLTDVEDFEDAMHLAEKGDPGKVDMMVGDIYGDKSDALEKLGLPSNIVASSFGKLVAKEDPAAGLEQEDLARALLLMITNNIGQVAYLNAKLHNTPRIYFVGNFLRRNMISQQRLSYAINYWSKGEMEALFLEHEGYFGALGAFLMSQNIAQDDEGFFQWGDQGNDEANHEAKEGGLKQRRRNNSFMHRRHKTFSS